MKPQREWFLQVPWGKMALKSYGHPDGEPVFLVHGRQDSLSVFDPLIEQMSNDFYYVALDMPGNGLSDAFPHVTDVPLRRHELSYTVVFDRPPQPGRPFIDHTQLSQGLLYTGKEPHGGPKLQRFHFLYAMELAILHLGWDKFIFMGHSMGCEQGIFFNVIHPDQITRMILLDAGPTLMRMQVDDNEEYQRTFYDNYYDNYKRECFSRKRYSFMLAKQAIMRVRDLTEDQCAHILSRNFKDLGDISPNLEIRHIDGAHSLENTPIANYQLQNSNGPSANAEDAGNAEVTGKAEVAGNTEEARMAEETGMSEDVGNAEEVGMAEEAEIAEPAGNAKHVGNADAAQNADDVEHPLGPESFNNFIERMRNDDAAGYLSWDNRLKNLAPQNYGNEYYFELFKKIPPTLLIAASNGAKHVPPNPKWRQGTKELLDKMATLDNFQRVDVEGSHDVHYTHPEIVLPYINAFLKDNKVLSNL